MDEADPRGVAGPKTYDQYVPATGALEIVANGEGRACIAYAGRDFGAGTATADYQTTSVGGDAGHCSLTTGLLCVFDEDCPSGETCTVTGGAFTLRYRIELVP